MKIFLILIFVIMTPKLSFATIIETENKTHEGMAQFKRELVFKLEAPPARIGETYLAKYNNSFNLSVKKSAYVCNSFVILNGSSSTPKPVLTINDDRRTLDVFKIESGVNFIFTKDKRVFTMSCTTKFVEQDFISITESLNSKLGVEFKNIKALRPDPVVTPEAAPPKKTGTKS